MAVTEIEMFGRVLPLNPLATAGRHPCAVCGLRYLRALDATHHLCPHCAEDLPRTRAHVTAMLAGVERQIDALSEAEAARVAALPDDVGARWERAHYAWQAADRQLAAAQTQRWPSATPLETRAQAVRDARARLEAVNAKLARTEAAGGPMGAAVGAWRGYQRELARLQQELTRWLVAADEVTCCEDGTPF